MNLDIRIDIHALIALSQRKKKAGKQKKQQIQQTEQKKLIEDQNIQQEETEKQNYYQEEIFASTQNNPPKRKIKQTFVEEDQNPSGLCKFFNNICSCFCSKKRKHKRLPIYKKLLLTPPTSKITLVLDLDETLVHSQFTFIPNPDYIIPYKYHNKICNIYVLKRPYLDIFLKEACELFEVVVFTASVKKYAEPLMNHIDRQKRIKQTLYRNQCTMHKGVYVKDLSLLGRDLNRVVIIDNSSSSFLFQPQNGITIKSWFDDKNDYELESLLNYLKKLASVENVVQEMQKNPWNPKQKLNQTEKNELNIIEENYNQFIEQFVTGDQNKIEQDVQTENQLPEASENVQNYRQSYHCNCLNELQKSKSVEVVQILVAPEMNKFLSQNQKYRIRKSLKEDLIQRSILNINSPVAPEGLNIIQLLNEEDKKFTQETQPEQMNSPLSDLVNEQTLQKHFHSYAKEEELADRKKEGESVANNTAVTQLTENS